MRPVAALTGVSHTTGYEWRDWWKAGAKPEDLPKITPRSRRLVRSYLRLHADDRLRRDAARLAAERLAELVEQLKKEADEVSPPTEAAPDPTEIADSGRPSRRKGKRKGSEPGN